MSDFDNTNRGVLFKNTDKKAGNSAHEKWPDYQGRLNVNGADLWLSAWIKTDKSGRKYMSLSVKPKNSDAARQTNAAKSAGGGSAPRDFDDAIPFSPEFR